MDTLLPIIVSFFAAPVICFYFFGKCCSVKVSWYWAIVYAALSLLLSVLEDSVSLWGIASLFLEICLLSLAGILWLACRPFQAFTISSLIISILCVSSEIITSLKYTIVASLEGSPFIILKYIDLSGSILGILLLLFSFYSIHRTFNGCIRSLHHSTYLLLSLPLLFIALVEKTVSSAVFGNTVVWDYYSGLVSPIVNGPEMLILQIFAVVGLYSALAAFNRLNQIIKSEQTIKLLEQQSHEQRIYLGEALSRYESTRSFRHDIKNHLLVLGRLLKDGNEKDAFSYLSTLEQMSDTLSISGETGNSAVDALLGSKLEAAKQNQIKTDCQILIPKNCAVKDIDWCIILSNAIDNAIHASSLLPAELRQLKIHGSQKGNFYFLRIENNCREMTEIPADGIGLSNIKAVVESYGGTTDIEISGDRFKLNLLLIISQQ